MDLVGPVDREVAHSPATNLMTGAVGVAVVGLGYAGCHHLERLNLRDDFRIAGTFDVESAAARKAAGLSPRSFRSWRELLTDESVELVLLATPPATHSELAIEALAAGRHVLVETPMCLDLHSADLMLDAARRSGRSLIVTGPAADDHEFVAAKSCVLSGTLGRPLSIKHIAWQYRPKMWGEGARECASTASTWRRKWTTGGGALWEFGALRIAQLLQLVDEFPESVFARLYCLPAEYQSQCWVNEANSVGATVPTAGNSPAVAPFSDSLEDGFLLFIRFPSGLVAHLEACSAYAAPIWVGWTIAGSSGTFANGTHYSTTSEGEVVDVPLPAGRPTGDELYTAVVRHLRQGLKNPNPAVDSRTVVATIEAARRSEQSGVPEPVGGMSTHRGRSNGSDSAGRSA